MHIPRVAIPIRFVGRMALAWAPLVALGGLSGVASAAVTCESLASASLPQTVITAAQLVPAGSFQPPTGGAQANLPEFCRIAGRIENHPTSRIMFEVWMPTQVHNQRFIQVGNGGFAGTIQFGAMAPRLREGFATASTDDGTSAPPGVPASQRLTLLGDLERVYDFKGRAVTLTAGVAKLLYQAYYGTAPLYSYFTGNSSGGLEALAVAQRIGNQFDGVQAGCPASNSAGLFTQAIWTSQNYQKLSSKINLIRDAVRAACDVAGDGVQDGLIGNPEKCTFDPGVLQCTGDDQPTCLTAEQVDAARNIYKGPVNPATGTKTGEQYAPGMPRGSETAWSGSVGQASGASQPWYGMLLYNSLTFDMSTFDFNADVTRALNMTINYGAQVTNPDLSQFRDHGGKLILWAGWNDPLWSQQNIVNYYKQIISRNITPIPGRPVNTPQLGAAALARTQSFARLFMAPGVGHCGGGDGASPQDTFTPLVRWVEQGIAPDSILATRFVNNQASQGIAYTRPLCAYPKVAKWDGQGNPNDAASFVCTAP